MVISLIVAAAENGVIGNAGTLPWRMPSDLRTFRRLTLGKPIIMGRKTFQSIGKPLDGRDNIVVTRDTGFAVAGAIRAASIDVALCLAEPLARARGTDEIMVIGGAEIYRIALPHADRVYLTRIHATPAGDTTFPELSSAVWRETERNLIIPDPRDEFAATLMVHERRQ